MTMIVSSSFQIVKLYDTIIILSSSKLYDIVDNISFVGMSSSVKVAEEQSTERVCVMIQGLDTSDIFPLLTVPLNISIQNTTYIGMQVSKLHP
jgi:hypothetical protein